MAKRDLAITPPLLNASGYLGFYPDRHSLVEWSRLGAFITAPISLAPRTPAHGRRFVNFPGGFLLHTGYPNPGFGQAIRRYAQQWSHAPIPVIVHLLAHDAGEVASMVRRLEPLEGVMGVEIGLTSDASLDQAIALTQAAFGELAVIMCLPMERSLELAPAVIHAGATAVSLAPVRGAYPVGNGETLQGRLYGPATLPLALKAVQALTHMGIPTIGAGGVYTQEHKDAMLAAGALAVQLDSFLWRQAGYNLFT